MALVTYIPRFAPVWWISSRTLPTLLVSWLRYVPVAVLSAMLLPALLRADGRQMHFAPDNIFLWAALPTLAVARKTRSLFGAVVVGMVTVALIRMVWR